MINIKDRGERKNNNKYAKKNKSKSVIFIFCILVLKNALNIAPIAIEINANPFKVPIYDLE